LSESLVWGQFGENTAHGGTGVATEGAYYLHQTGTPDEPAYFTRISPLLKTVTGKPLGPLSESSASDDFSHIIFGYFGNSNQGLLPEDKAELTRLYEVTGAGGLAPSLRLVALDEKGTEIDPYCAVTLGGGSAFNAVSKDGSEVFFTTSANLAETTSCGTPTNPAILYARVNGSRTLELSKPLAKDCAELEPCHSGKQASAIYEGASADGSKAFFMSEQPLVNGDEEDKGVVSNDLYMAVLEGEKVKELVQVSHDPHPGEAAEVRGVVRTSGDGSHAYFVATGVLAGMNGEGHSPEAGAANLYVFDSVTRSLTFVATLRTSAEIKTAEQEYIEGVERKFKCDGSGPSPGIEHILCEQAKSTAREEARSSSLWQTGDHDREAQNTYDGQFLLFSTEEKLTADDTDTAKDVYRYDAATKRLQRVSIGENGNGSVDAHIVAPSHMGRVYEQQELGVRAISEDGSTVVFSTAEPLSPRAINGLEDIYVWHEGEVGMISDGSAHERDGPPVISLSGNDVFFSTVDGLVAQDTNGLRDVYDARVGGGFPESEAPQAACGGGCQTPLGLVPPLPFPSGSAIQSPGGNVEPVRSKSRSTSRSNAGLRLMRALKACGKKAKRSKRACERRARKRYGGVTKGAKASNGRQVARAQHGRRTRGSGKRSVR
jgi:hypothetical protein